MEDVLFLFGMFYDHWYTYLMVILYACSSFGIFFPTLVCCNGKIWQPCLLDCGTAYLDGNFFVLAADYLVFGRILRT
jgi:hypothetical protein